MSSMDDLDRQIVNTLQGGFPVCDDPFDVVASQLGITGEALRARIESLLEHKILTRFGPMFQIERMGGAFTLAAMRVPDADFDRVAALVNDFPEVAHNYRREHEFNMWFVLATASPGGIGDAITRIQACTGLPVYNMPKEREYFVGARFSA